MFDPASIAADLGAGIAQLGLSLPEAVQGQLLRYLQLLAKWNRVFNLTAVRDPRRMVTHHLLDSLALLPFVRGPRLVDVGSGAGLPGLVLALAEPRWRCVLLDSRGRKVRFLTQAVIELGLANAEVVQARVERYRPGLLFDSVLSRAFGSLSDFYALAGHLRGPGGRLLAPKGAYPAAELRALRQRGVGYAVQRLRVPGVDRERHLVIIE